MPAKRTSRMTTSSSRRRAAQARRSRARGTIPETWTGTPPRAHQPASSRGATNSR
ncbi:MAG TPA: hypothetical protein VH478_09145 [Trebonia sp.]|nr:hypothetical protein [Trebonia sp.]